MDYFETDSNSSAPKRVPLSLRLPVQVVESVDRYASENRMSKTDAFLHFLRRGMDAERGGASFGSACRNQRTAFGDQRHAVGKKRRSIRGGCFRARSRCSSRLGVPRNRARVPVRLFRAGTFGSDSDVDVRIEYDHGMSFNLHDVSQFGKRIEQATGREVDVVSTDRIKKEGLAAAIERDKELVYEREAR